MAETILDRLEKPRSSIRFVKDRPGHDRRYAIDFSKAGEELGWEPLIPFEEGIHMTVQWYRSHRDWWMEIKSGEYLDYYRRMYGNR